jgi:hypothetical protein
MLRSIAPLAALALLVGCSSSSDSSPAGAGGSATTSAPGGAGGASTISSSTSTSSSTTSGTGGGGGATSAGGSGGGGGATSAGGSGGAHAGGAGPGGGGSGGASAGGAGGSGGAGGAPCVDADADGYPSSACGGTDCDDADPAVHPGVPEADDWQTIVIASGGTYTDVRMALGPAGEPHLVYFDGPHGEVVHATQPKGGAWSFETTTKGAVADRNPVLAVDAAGHVHVAYYGGNPQNTLTADLRYLTNASGAWVSETVDSVADMRDEPSIAVDAAGVVHLAYVESGSSQLRYARREKGAWTKEVVDSAGAPGDECQIDVHDPAGPSVLYNLPFDDLRFSVRGPNGWKAQSEPHLGWPGIGLSIGFDGAGHRHYAHWDLQSGHLNHTTDSPAWATEDLGDFGVAFSRPTAIAFRGATGFIAFPWFDGGDEAVFVGKLVAGKLTVERVMQHISDVTIVAHTSVAVDLDQKLLVSSPRRLSANSPMELVLLTRIPTDGVDQGCNGE